MATYQERSRRLYGDPPKTPTTTARAAPASSREAAGNRLYSKVGYGAALASYFDRRRAGLRDDAEGLALSRVEERQVEAFARAHGIAPNDLHQVLAVVREHDVHPKSPEVIEQRWALAFETLRLKHGGREPAQGVLNSYANLTVQLTKEIPTLADRAGRSGAANDVRVIEALAPYGVPAPTPKQE